MAKHSDEQRKRITKSIQESGKKDMPFFRVYADLFRSEQFQALTAKAQLLYIDMGIKSGTNIDDFTFPPREYKKRFAKHTFIACKSQLIEAGFIKEIAYKNQESHFALSSEWMRKRPEN